MHFFVNLSELSFTLLDGFLSPKGYIDPNTGGMIFQVLAALLAVFSGVLFFFSRQIKTLFARLRRKARENEEPDKESGEKAEQ